MNETLVYELHVLYNGLCTRITLISHEDHLVSLVAAMSSFPSDSVSLMQAKISRNIMDTSLPVFFNFQTNI
jgi:hypothetical protein